MVFSSVQRDNQCWSAAAAGGFPPLKLAGAQATLSWKTAEMAAVWMVLCVLTVCLAGGIYLFDNCIEDEGIMFDLTACFLSTVSGFPAGEYKLQRRLKHLILWSVSFLCLTLTFNYNVSYRSVSQWDLLKESLFTFPVDGVPVRPRC